ncbi:hypothetical protein FRC12_002836 [Ceratobasidium sp. 428]|nr:hypothetical protein FRC12_002836 [Ceratobasidium sp. 428]
MSLPHQDWEQEHFARGMACNSTDADRVAYTLKNSIPYVVIQLLPKRHDYDEDFAGLCNDIGSLNPRALYYTWKDCSDVDYLLTQSMSNLSVTVPPTLSVAAPAPSLPYTASLRASLAPHPLSGMTPARPGTLGQHQSTPAKAPPSTPSTQRDNCAVSFAPTTPSATKDMPPHMPDASLSQPPVPPSTPVQPRTAIPPQTRLWNLEQGPAPPSAEFLARLQEVQKPNTILPDFALEDTPEAHGQYQASVTRFEVNHGTLGPWFTRPFPLSPGTRKQTIDLCTVCAKGNHPTYLCPAETLGGRIPERERTYREMLVSDLRRAAKKNRAGEQPYTPTPGQRTRDVNQVEYEETKVQALEEEDEEEWDAYAWYYAGKGQGR